MSSTPTQVLLNGSQFVRCVLLSRAEEEQLTDEATQHSYCFIEVDLAKTQTRDDLMERMAYALDFPNYFGKNWDAFLDLVTDLSWNPASGYVVLLRNAEALVELSSEDLGIFVRLCSAAVERWRSGEDEDGKIIPKTPFYFLLEGHAPFCRLITYLLTKGGSI